MATAADGTYPTGMHSYLNKQEVSKKWGNVMFFAQINKQTNKQDVTLGAYFGQFMSEHLLGRFKSFNLCVDFKTQGFSHSSRSKI